ncbi:hypothetical protein MVEN_00678400 [Mycena venus]|uniref:DUF6532 domain-containing protein n=1 Tax=Mycena venus TaxID=2733690 RepID=A0A8H7D8Y9_9AGAR|nr:hypothetical protein MVEN_00678400 [Mycena venus]
MPSTTKGTQPKKAKQSELERLIAKQKLQQKKTEKLLAEANAKLLAKCNSDMLDEEEDAAPVKKKAKSTRSSSEATASDAFGEDDADALDGLLGSSRVTAADATDKDSDDGSNPDPGAVHDDGRQMEDSEDDEDDELPPSSDMLVEGPIKKSAHRRAKSKGGSSRVTQSTFSPGSVRLANVGRHAVRVEVATKEGFPLDHSAFAWAAMSDVVAASDSPELADRLSMAMDSDERRSQLTAYAWGGAPQVRGEVKTLAKGAVGLFGIPGNFTPDEIAGHIKWLTGKTGIFKFGGIDLEARTYNVQQPYGSPFYKDVMTQQWFDNAKSEGVRAASFQNFINSPVPILTLMTLR